VIFSLSCELNLYISSYLWWISYNLQGDHSPGKPGKVDELQSGQGKWEKSRKTGISFAGPRGQTHWKNETKF